MNRMSTSSIRSGDTVKVIAGVDRGKQGKVTQIFQEERRVVVEGVQKRAKHIRTRQQSRQKQKGEIIHFHAPIAISNVQLICPHCQKPTRVGHTAVGDTKKRLCRKCKQVIDA